MLITICENIERAIEMTEFFKRLFCKHKNSEVVCWHWTHGFITNKGMTTLTSSIGNIEVQYKCNDCGKYYFKGIENWEKCREFASKYKDKQWSDTCKPKL